MKYLNTIIIALIVASGCAAPKEAQAPVVEAPEELAPPFEAGFDKYFGSLYIEREATGFFRVEQIDGRWWLITPEGHPFFSVGVNGLRIVGTPTADGVKHYEQAALQIYGDRETWAAAQFDRCAEWGINSVGAWSDWELFVDRLPYTIILHVGGANWLTGDLADYFDPAFAAAAGEEFQKTAAPLADDPFLIGYFLDNEMRWGPDWRGGHLFDDYFAAPGDGSSHGKTALIDYLKNRYPTLDQLKADFVTDAASWGELAAQTALPAADTAGARKTRAAWTGEVAEQFFSVLSELLKESDPNHLNLGVRFVSQVTPRAAIEAAGRYVDVMSINFYDFVGDLENQLQGWDPDYLAVADFLAEHYAAGGKPIMISEWGYRAAGAGPPNSWPPMYPILADQAERADAYEAYFTNVLDRPWFVGTHWFTYIDQPPEGRFDGEDNNFGIINEADQPYPELTERIADLYPRIYNRLATATTE